MTIYADPAELARAAAELITDAAARAIAARGRFTLALAGGETPRATYTCLAHAPFKRRIDWARVHVGWGDERCVPPDDLTSDYRMAREALLEHVPIPADNIHRMAGELDPHDAADRYEAELHTLFPTPWPRFDLILLGLGEDGHTASLFPGTTAVEETQRWVVANHVPKLGAWRLTLTLPVLNAAEEVVFLVEGARKAVAFAAALRDANPASPYPAARVHPTAGTLRWLVDAHAAAGLAM